MNEKPSWAEIGKLTEENKQLKDKNENLKSWNRKQSSKIEELETENQSLHDQITQMENERLKIDKLARAIGKFAESIVKSTV